MQGLLCNSALLSFGIRWMSLMLVSRSVPSVWCRCSVHAVEYLPEKYHSLAALISAAACESPLNGYSGQCCSFHTVGLLHDFLE